jgi:cleavage and polyadenylation specificity factor subunit 3
MDLDLDLKTSPQSRLDAVLAFLQDQFGTANVSLIETTQPRSPANGTKPDVEGDETKPKHEDNDDTKDDVHVRETDADLTRLRKLGIPVPGIRIRIDPKMDATVWLEHLNVECAHKAFGDRVRAVLERALDMVDGAVF